MNKPKTKFFNYFNYFKREVEKEKEPMETQVGAVWTEEDYIQEIKKLDEVISHERQRGNMKEKSLYDTINKLTLNYEQQLEEKENQIFKLSASILQIKEDTRRKRMRGKR